MARTCRFVACLAVILAVTSPALAQRGGSGGTGTGGTGGGFGSGGFGTGGTGGFGTGGTNGFGNSGFGTSSSGNNVAQQIQNFSGASSGTGAASGTSGGIGTSGSNINLNGDLFGQNRSAFGATSGALSNQQGFFNSGQTSGNQRNTGRGGNSQRNTNRNGTNAGNGGASKLTLRPQSKISFRFPKVERTELATQLTARVQDRPGTFPGRPLVLEFTDSGKVILKGQVASEDARDLIEAYVRLEPGVYGVENRLSVAGTNAE